MTGKHMTANEVLERLNIHRNTLRKLVDAGQFPNAFQIGKSWRFPESDVATFIANCQAKRKAVPA